MLSQTKIINLKYVSWVRTLTCFRVNDTAPFLLFYLKNKTKLNKTTLGL